MLIKVAIVEDNPENQKCLKLMIESSDELFCSGVFENAESFSNIFKHLDVDVVLMDINLPGNNGIECVRELKKINPKVEFLMCTHLEDADKIYAALKVGATGYILKNTTTEKLIDAVKEIYAGGSPMTPQIARKVIKAFPGDDKDSELVNTLTKREKEIAELLSLGYPYKIVADKLAISIETVRTRIRDIYSKLQVHSRTDAINMLYPKTKNRI